MSYIFTKNLDDLQDALERCQETARAFPESGTSHEDIARFDTKEEAEALCVMVDKVYAGEENIVIAYRCIADLYFVEIRYTLSPDELEEAFSALEDYYKDVRPEDIPPMDPNNPADRELMDIAQDMMKELRRLEAEDEEEEEKDVD